MANGLLGDWHPVRDAMHTASISRIIIYLRVSTVEQDESGLGIKAQRARCEDYARFVGAKIVAEYKDALSAKDLDRPELAAALAAVRRGEADALVVAKLDRLARSVRDFLGILDESIANNWALVCVQERFESTGIGRLMATVIAAFAEWERGVISERTKAGMAQARKQRFFTGGTLPPGCATEPIGEHKRVIRGPNADIVEQIWPMAIAGKTLSEIADWLNGKIQSKYDSATIYQLLQSDYCRDADLVTLEDQRAAMAAVATRSFGGGNRGTRNTTFSYLEGLVRCPSCGGRLSTYTSRHGSPYLRCPRRKGHKCLQKDLPGRAIEEAADEFLIGCFRSDIFKQKWRESVQAQRLEAKRHIDALQEAEADLRITEAGIQAIAANADPKSPAWAKMAKVHDGKLLAARRRAQAAKDAVQAAQSLQPDGGDAAANIPSTGILTAAQRLSMRRWASSCIASVALATDGSIQAIFASPLAAMAAAQGGHLDGEIHHNRGSAHPAGLLPQNDGTQPFRAGFVLSSLARREQLGANLLRISVTDGQYAVCEVAQSVAV